MKSDIVTRYSYTEGDFVNVVSLLANELSRFLDYWANVPRYVEEDVTRSAARLQDEIEVMWKSRAPMVLLNSFLVVSHSML
jgi:hypothetical protein